MRLRLLSYTLIFVLLLGCSENPQFEYGEGLNAYLSATYDTSIHDVASETSVFLYLEYCRSCVSDALLLIDSMKNHKDNIHLYLIGDQNFYPENIKTIEKFKERFSFDEDPNSNHYSYITGIGEPLVLEVKSGKVKSYQYIKTGNFENVWELLRKD